ncbi:MAG TPA: hypothetical protein VD741_05480 [Solirubrobacterales bacterium]|nr:hypothetical protein [Solirubrobacterales bacterium]
MSSNRKELGDESRWRRTVGWLGEHVAVPISVGTAVTAVSLFFLTPLGNSDGDDTPPAPPLSTQWLHVHADIARQGWKIVKKRTADLRGNGEPSTILVLSPPAKSCLSKTPAHSEQVRIYDVEEGKLERQLTFQPKTLGCPPWEFEFMKIAPLREYGDAPIILGRFSGGDDAFFEELTIPVAIAWSDRVGDYNLRPLLVQPPSLAVVNGYGDGRPLTGFDRTWYEKARKVYGHPVDLGSDVSGYAVEEVALGHSTLMGSPILAGIYRLTAGNAGRRREVATPILFQQAIWQLTTTPSGDLYAGACIIPGGRVVQAFESFPTARKLAAYVDLVISGCDEY